MQHETNVITMILRYLISGLLGIWILGTTPVWSFYSPQHVMVDVTNDFGVCVLQLIASKKENIAFSPYGLVSVALVLYEGSTGPSAAEIHNSLRLPWDREVTRVGFRDMHRYLKSYFSNDGFLRGLVLSKPNIGLRKNYTDLLQFYGFDVRTSQPHVPPTQMPPTLTTLSPATTRTTTTSKTPVTTKVPERTTTTPPPDTTPFTLTSRFGSTTTSSPKQQTTLLATVTTSSPQTNLPSSRTTLERSTVTTAVPTKTRPPTTKKAEETTRMTTTTKPTTTTSMPTTTQPPMTTTTPKPTTSATTATTSPTTTASVTTQTTPPETTMDVVTMTDKKPNTLEIMSQVNMSAITTTALPKPDMEEREGDMDMMGLTEKPSETTTQRSAVAVETTTKPLETTTDRQETAAETQKTTVKPQETTSKQQETTFTQETEKPRAEGSTVVMQSEVTTTKTPITTTIPEPKDATTQGSITNVEVSVAETTVVKSVSMSIPNTTPTPEMEPTAEQAEDLTTPQKPEQVTLIIETTVTSLASTSNEDSTAMASESMIDQATTLQEPEATTIQPEITTVPQVETTASSQPQPTEESKAQTVTNVAVTVETTSLPVTVTEATTTEPATTTQVPTSTVSTSTASPTQTTLEMIDSAASENRLAAALARQQRSLYSTRQTPEQQQSGSNWVPHYYDQRWGRNPSNEFWFFTYTGGENVQAHTYTAYLPFAFVPELASLVLQLPLDDPRYSILILLPEERMGLSQLLYQLQWCPVRAIMTRLKMTAVYAVVPAFTIVKHINLVPALAKLGIHSVFDPFRADLSPMTSEPHLFVRTIEQVVTVSLRKYYTSNRWFEATPSEVQQHFVANHPFVYFVLDKETDVTLMAGTIVNPVAHNQ